MLSKLQNLRKESEGFTIVEVMIVLAIAGLIVLIVFLAIPALQRNSRNTQLRNDAQKAVGLLQETVNNSNGQLPTGTTVPSNLATGNAQYSKISAVDYSVTASSPSAALPTTLAADTLYIRNFSTCGAGGGGQVGSNSGGSQRQASFTWLVESAGAAAVSPAPAGYVAQCQQL